MRLITTRYLKIMPCMMVVMIMGGDLSILAQNVLPSNVRLNGKLVWEAFEPQREVLQSSSAVIYTDKKSHVKSVYGVVVSPHCAK